MSHEQLVIVLVNGQSVRDFPMPFIESISCDFCDLSAEGSVVPICFRPYLVKRLKGITKFTTDLQSSAAAP
jgi:hypothetical protein